MDCMEERNVHFGSDVVHYSLLYQVFQEKTKIYKAKGKK